MKRAASSSGWFVAGVLFGAMAFMGADEYTGAASRFVYGPANNAVAATPHASTDESETSKGVYVGTGGDLVVEMRDAANNAEVTFSNVQSGTVLPIRVDRIDDSSTATNVILLYD